MMHELDVSVGKVVRALKEKNMLESSIIVFSGDNGGAANGMDGNIASNWPLRGVNTLSSIASYFKISKLAFLLGKKYDMGRRYKLKK